jgi:hypothetical protein
MSREIIVGREHIVSGGHHGHHDYDELMEMGADPAPHHPAPPALPPAPHHAAHPSHHHHHGGHPSHHHHGGHPHGGHYAPAVHVTHHHEPAPHYDHGHGHAYSSPTYERRERLRIVKEEPRHARQFPIGFQSDNVKPGDETDIEVKPQVLFRGERLAIAQSIARFFDVLDIKVGKDSQLAATGALTGEAFETRAVGVRMELDTAEPGIVITLRIRNTDAAAHDFKAVLYGSVLE